MLLRIAFIYLTLISISHGAAPFVQCAVKLSPNRTFWTSETEPLVRLTVGSCFHQRNQSLFNVWEQIATQTPQAHIMLGDNIYADGDVAPKPTTEMSHQEFVTHLQKQYGLLVSHPIYKKFREKFPFFFVPDDHDLGAPDAGNDFIHLKTSIEIARQQLQSSIPFVSPEHGNYTALLWGPKGKQVKIIMLDTRMEKDPIQKVDASLLGKTQWEWLETELAKNEADVHFIFSSIQVLPVDDPHGAKRWVRYEKERKKLLDLILKYQPKRMVLISGDRHFSEYMEMPLNTPGYQKVLPELTTSGMTHFYKDFDPEKEQNRFRQAVLVARNFAQLDINWSKKEPEVTVTAKELMDAQAQNMGRVISRRVRFK